MFTRAYYKTYGLQAFITRCTNNFGPFQFPEKLIPKTIIRAFLDLQVPIYGSGKQIRDWIYVLDHCEALDLVLRKGRPGEIYNISSGNELENIQVVEMILDIMNKPKCLIKHVEDRPGHDFRYSLDSSKIRSELGWKPKYSFEEALKKTVKWYINNENWWRPLATDQVLNSTPWKLKW
jgi:dTDP-glucose 4,6-dehydratase